MAKGIKKSMVLEYYFILMEENTRDNSKMISNMVLENNITILDQYIRAILKKEHVISSANLFF